MGVVASSAMANMAPGREEQRQKTPTLRRPTSAMSCTDMYDSGALSSGVYLIVACSFDRSRAGGVCTITIVFCILPSHRLRQSLLQNLLSLIS